MCFAQRIPQDASWKESAQVEVDPILRKRGTMLQHNRRFSKKEGHLDHTFCPPNLESTMEFEQRQVGDIFSVTESVY